LPHGLVFGDDAGLVLNGHLIAREFDHLRAMRDVLIVKGSAFQWIEVLFPANIRSNAFLWVAHQHFEP
jgi:hypothetical protein